MQKLLGFFDKKGLDAVEAVFIGNVRVEREFCFVFFAQCGKKAFNAVRRIGNEQGKATVFEAVILGECVGIDNVHFVLSIHECGHFGDFGEAVFFFHAVNVRVEIGGVLPTLQQRFNLACVFSEEMPCAAGVVDYFGSFAVLQQFSQRQAGNQEFDYRHGREKLSFGLLYALV